MIDIEKVIKGLEICYYPPSKCENCPYHNLPDGQLCTDRLLRDVLAILKEQEAKEQCLKTKCVICPHCDHCDVDENGQLKEKETSNTGKARIFQCEKCGYGFDDIFLTDEHNYDIEPNYCPNCGRLVKLNA